MSPQNNLIAEDVSTERKGKYGTEMEEMLRGDGEAHYDELFSLACPKFIAAWPPVLKEPFTNYNQVLSKANIATVFFFCIYILLYPRLG